MHEILLGKEKNNGKLPVTAEIWGGDKLRVLQVSLPNGITLMQAEDFMSRIYNDATTKLEKVSRDIPETKRGRRRSNSQIRQIRKQWEHRRQSLNDLRDVLRGTRKGVVTIIASSENEIVGFQID